jgi:hypothetical protein
MSTTTIADGMTIRRRRLLRRELEARARGWVGPWPPARRAPRSGAEAREFIRRLEAGEWRAGLIATLASNLCALADELSIEDLHRYGAVLKTILDNGDAAPRTLLRAAQAPLRVLQHAADRLSRFREELLLYEIEGFLDGFGPHGFQRAAAVLGKLTGAAGPQFVWLRAARGLMTAVLATMKTLATVPGIDPEQERVAEPDPAKLAQAERELKEIEARIVASRTS